MIPLIVTEGPGLIVCASNAKGSGLMKIAVATKELRDLFSRY